MNNNKSSNMRFNQMNFYLVMANVFSLFVDVYDIICNLLRSIREFLISIYLNNTIYKIQYIDNFNHDEYKITNVYNLLNTPYELFRVIFFNNNNNNEISLNFDNILYKLENIIYGNALNVGSYMIYVGSKTGNEGINGALMSSQQFDVDNMDFESLKKIYRWEILF